MSNGQESRESLLPEQEPVNFFSVFLSERLCILFYILLPSRCLSHPLFSVAIRSPFHVHILDLALPYLYGPWDLEKFGAPPSYSLWDLEKFRILPLCMGLGTWKNSELCLYTGFGI